MLDTPIYKAKREDLSRLVQYRDMEGLAVLTGSAPIFPLAHSWIALLIANGFKVHVIDCAIRFNIYRVINEANILSIDVHDFLFTGTIQRAFTPYQILDTCIRVLKEKANPNEVYFILAPSKQFFDGDVKEREGYYLLEKLIAVFGRMQSKGIQLIAVETPKYKNKTFKELFPTLLKIANTTWNYNSFVIGKETFQRFQIHNKKLFIRDIEFQLTEEGVNAKNSKDLFNSPATNDRAIE